MLIVAQQIDLGEETGPRTVVSGLVNYIPIEQMRDKYLVAVVCRLAPLSRSLFDKLKLVQFKTGKYARSEKLRDGPLRK